MKTTTFAIVSSVLGSTVAQGVTQQISPSAAIPAGCETSFSSKFEISVVKLSGNSKRDVVVNKRADVCKTPGILVASLSGSTLSDAQSRTGYIASNFQFQFDGPPQAGAIYTSGWSVCDSGATLALGNSTTFYACQSGDFYNLYDRNWAAQCSPVKIAIISCDAADPPGDASQLGDGQVVGTTFAPTTAVVPLSDGQPQVVTTVVPIPLCQISDGQLQVHTTPCASITSTPVVATTTLVPVSQYTDGQLQVTPAPTGASGGSAAPAPTSGGASPAPTGGATTVTGVSSASVNGTIVTSSKPTGSSASTSTSPTTPANAAGRGFEMNSPLAALAVGVLGAVWVL